MSTITVDPDLLPALRENVRLSLGLLADTLSGACDAGKPLDQIAELCDAVECGIAAHRAMVPNAGSYPSAAVRFAVRSTIEDVEARLADDSLSIDEAERWVLQARACQALQAELAEPQAVTA